MRMGMGSGLQPEIISTPLAHELWGIAPPDECPKCLIGYVHGNILPAVFSKRYGSMTDTNANPKMCVVKWVCQKCRTKWSPSRQCHAPFPEGTR